jgi:hypothetical protein
MKTFIKSGIVSMLVCLIFPLAIAQNSNSGSYNGTIKNGDLSFLIANKTINGTLKSDWKFGTPKTIDVKLNGDGINIDTKTTSTETFSGYTSMMVDVFSGTINGQPVSGSFTRTYFGGVTGSVSIGNKTITADKKNLDYVLKYDNVSISCKRKTGTKAKFNMVWGDKKIDGTVTSKVNLGKDTCTSQYAFSSPDMSNDEIAVWLFLFISSEIFSGR